MGQTTFTDQVTVINNAWLNDADTLVWGVFNGAATDSQARANLGSTSVGDAVFIAANAAAARAATGAASSGANTDITSLNGATNGLDAPPGRIGEYQFASAGSSALTSAVAANILSITLAAGDWDVYGLVDYSTPGSVTMSRWAQDISTTGSTLSAYPSTVMGFGQTFNSGGSGNCTLPTPMQRISIAVSTTVYLVSYCFFSAGSLNAAGSIKARRAR